MMRVLAVAVAVTAAGGAAAGLDKIHACGRYFCDRAGRVRVFHGFNDIQEAKDSGTFDGRNFLPHLMADDRVRQELSEWGFNVVRMPMQWAAIQPGPALVDRSYLSAIRNLTQALAGRGLYSFLDMHQDVLSSRYGSYDGAPLWLVNRTVPRHPYPWPQKLPLSQWGLGYLTEAVAQSFQEIYHNTHGGRDAWAAAWRAAAAEFGRDPEILGYELLNEPFPGDVFADPLLLLPGVAGKQNLMPAYMHVADAIRSVDQETIIFYEPVTWGMIFDSNQLKVAGAGFDTVPGGPAYQNRSAFAFHYYCWFATGISEQKPSSGPYNKLNKFECDRAFGPLVFDSVEKTIGQIGGASILTEFGAMVPNRSAQDSLGTEEVEWVVGEADRRFQSWTYWDLTSLYGPPDSTGRRAPIMDRMMPFVRPYARAIAGIPVSTSFDCNSTVYTLGFNPIPQSGETEVVLPRARYPGGFQVQASSNLHWRACGTEQLSVLCVTASSTDAASLTVSPRA